MEANEDLEQLWRQHHDPSSFINHALKRCVSTHPEDMQKYSNDLYSKLQNIADQETEQVNSKLEQFRSSVSSVIHSSEHIQELFNSLKDELRGFQEQLSYSFEEDKSHSLQGLLAADRIARRLEETLNLLSHAKEAQDITDRIDTWQTTGDWEALAQAVRSLKTNLVSLKDLPQYSEFEEHLQTMKRRFEQLIRPQLYESLSNRDSIALAKIWKCCEETDQKDIFIDVWVSERSACIQKMWSNCWRQTFQAYSKQPHEITENISDKVFLDIHIPESLDILKSFYEQVLTDISQQTGIISPIMSQPVGNLITASITMAFSSLDPPLADSYDVSQELEINWIQDWHSVLEFYHNIMKECLIFTQKVASLAYQYQGTCFDIQVAISAIMIPALKFVTEFRTLVDSVWSAWCKALIVLKESNAKEAQEDVCTRVSFLLRSVDDYSYDISDVIESFIDKCRQWVLGSQLSSVSMLYLRFGRIVGEHILEKVAEERSNCIYYMMSFEQNWNPIRCVFRLAISWSRLQYNCWKQVSKGLNSCLMTVQPILDRCCPSSDSSNTQRLLETLVQDFIMETKNMDEFATSWLVLTEKENLDCIQFDSFKGPLGFSTSEFPNDPFEDTLLSIRKTLLELIVYKIEVALNKLSQVVIQMEEQFISEDEHQLFSSPQSYIIEAGEYLLLIPQMLETLAPEGTLELACCLPRSFEKDEVIEIMNSGPDCRNVDRNEFVRQWISVVSFWTMSYFIERILNDTKPKLSDYQCRQLNTDVEYLINIITALGVPVLKEVYVVYNILSKTQQSGLHLDEQEEEQEVAFAQLEFRFGRPLVRSLPRMQEIKQIVASKMLSPGEISH